jgi:uncharacterized protein
LLSVDVESKMKSNDDGNMEYYTEQEVEIPVVPAADKSNDDGGEKIRLFGTLTRPVTAAAATASAPSGDSSAGTNKMVIFVAGSGALDRDENARGAPLNVFNSLARALAKNHDGHGISSFRYDKRGSGKSTGKFLQAGVSDLLQDLLAVMDYCTTTLQTTADDHPAAGTTPPQLILVGHSEGTVLSAMASIQRPHLVKGMVLICPFITPMENVLLRQGALADAMLAEGKGCSGWLQRTITKWITGGSVQTSLKQLIQRINDSGDAPTIRYKLFTTLPAKWFRDHFALDYAAIYRDVPMACSLLLLVAGSDSQCDPKDGERIQQLFDEGDTNNDNDRCQLCTIERLSHLLRREDEDSKGFAGYGKQLKKDIDAEVVSTVVEYCRSRQAF